MLIMLRDADKLERRHACWGIRCDKGTFFSVIAVSEQRKIRKYLVEHDNRIEWWDADLFVVIDHTIPNDWVEATYRKHYKLKNPKYAFNISINYYLGPQSFLDNRDFLFDIYENPHSAYVVYKTG